MVAALYNPEKLRLQETRERNIPWKKWGPYVSERQWGTVREDYSRTGNALGLFSPRSSTFPCLPLGRRRTCRYL